MPLPPNLKKLQSALISRIKVMSGMNIAEKRKPQDGRINVRMKGSEIDIRVSTVPTVYESVSLRLLTRDNVLKGLESLGMTKAIENPIREIINQPHGIVLVTSLVPWVYFALCLFEYHYKGPWDEIRIMTVEDPVEYEIAGVNQVAVKNEIGLNFAHVLRHFLRQDPDVIMVGEIRDGETAGIAIQANTGAGV